MKLTSAALAFTLASSVLAKTITSKPFQLLVLSSLKKYNGTVLSALHEGAAIEGLSPEKNSVPAPTFTNYTFSYSSNVESSKEYGPSGQIFFDLPISGGVDGKLQ